MTDETPTNPTERREMKNRQLRQLRCVNGCENYGAALLHIHAVRPRYIDGRPGVEISVTCEFCDDATNIALSNHKGVMMVDPVAVSGTEAVQILSGRHEGWVTFPPEFEPGDMVPTPPARSQHSDQSEARA